MSAPHFGAAHHTGGLRKQTCDLEGEEHLMSEELPRQVLPGRDVIGRRRQQMLTPQIHTSCTHYVHSSACESAFSSHQPLQESLHATVYFAAVSALLDFVLHAAFGSGARYNQLPFYSHKRLHAAISALLDLVQHAASSISHSAAISACEKAAISALLEMLSSMRRRGVKPATSN